MQYTHVVKQFVTKELYMLYILKVVFAARTHVIERLVAVCSPKSITRRLSE
jgi:hypothetical protein